MCEFEFHSEMDYLIITAAFAAVKFLIFIIDQHIAIANTAGATCHHHLGYLHRRPRLHHAPPYPPPGGRRFLLLLSRHLTGHSHQRHLDRRLLRFDCRHLRCPIYQHRLYLVLVLCLRVSTG